MLPKLGGKAMSGETIDAEVVPVADISGAPDELARADMFPAAMALFSAISSGNNDPQSLMLSALAGQNSLPPEVSMLVKMLGGDGGGHTSALREQIREEFRAEQTEAFAELSHIAERLLNENQMARARLDSLAAGLGACPVCFGEDLLCETCNGVGAPGSRLPQPEEFNLFVSPACHRVQAEILGTSARRPWPRNPPPHFADLGVQMNSGE